METKQIQTIKVGDVISSSWGYDQTNVDFYKVVGLTKTMVKLRKLKQTTTESGYSMSGDTMPTDEFANDVVFKKKISSYDSEPTIYFDYGIGKVWDGKPEQCSWYA